MNSGQTERELTPTGRVGLTCGTEVCGHRRPGGPAKEPASGRRPWSAGTSGQRGARPSGEECLFAGACFVDVVAMYGLGLRESQRERSFDREPTY